VLVHREKRLSPRHSGRARWGPQNNSDMPRSLEVEFVYFADDASEACLEPATVRWLGEVASKAEAGDLEYLQNVGCVFQAVTG